MNKKIEELFALRVITDNPMFEGFALDDAPSVLGREDCQDDMTPGFGITDITQKWSSKKLEGIWKPPPVSGRVTSFNDFPGIDMMFPAFSRRACEVLKEFLEPNGELLPLKTDIGEYFFYNITKITDALNVKKSDCEFAPMEIEFFEFHRQKLKELSIFRILQWPMGTIVTDQFVKQVREHGLNGFDFLKIWPYEQGINWRLEAKKKRKKAAISKKLKQNVLVIILQFKKTKPNASEKRIVKQIEDELDAQLIIPSLDSPYFGSYEGIDTIDGEFRLFLSCPDVERLVLKLDPWLNQIEWPSNVYIMKRYGEIHDADAEETVEQIK